MDRADREPGVRSNQVTVILEGNLDNAAAGLIKNLSGTVRFSTKGGHEVSIPAGKLKALRNGLPDASLLRLPYPHAPALVTSQGVSLTGALDMQTLDNGGAGVTIGIIDLGFANIAAAQAAGELPADLTLTDYTGTGTGGIDHGTNVAQIVHDMAPNATLVLAKINSDTQMDAALTAMIAAGVRIINHSVAWYGAAFYDGSGSICAIADRAATNDILWVNANGNDRNKHYLATFSDTNGDLRHNFAANQNYNTITLNANATVDLVLNWDDYASATVNYDLYLYNGVPGAGGSIVAQSTNIQGVGGWYPPYEIITYTAPATGTYYLVVTKKYSSTANKPFTIFSLGPDLGVKTYASSVAQPADGNAVLSAGATNLSDTPEGFSSEGPTTDGRLKPEIAGPDGVRTSLSSAFYGTSAAAPHVAGAGALVLGQTPSLTTTQLRQALIQTAKDVSTVGFDSRTGYGRLSLDADQDGWNHDQDNCALITNADQLNTDNDSLGNACDADDDNDGLADTLEIQIGSNPLLLDTDGDGLSDYFEVAFGGNAAAYTVGVDLNPLAQDTDGDTLNDYIELAYGGYPGVYNTGTDLNPLATDTDGDGFPDNTDPLPLLLNYQDGDIAPLGHPDGVANAADYALALRIVTGDLAPSALELSHLDLYPVGAPDGTIDLSDIALLMKLIK